MQNNQSSYFRLSKLVAIILALLLLFMMLMGHGPSHSCCAGANIPVETAEPPAAVSSAAIAETSGFKFSATTADFTSAGDTSLAPWVANAEALKSILTNDSELKAEGDDKHVVLTGSVTSEAIKQQKGADAQTFFGSDVTVDNQIMIKATEPMQAAAPAAEAPTALPVAPTPAAAKLYFDTGKTKLPADANTTLSPIVDWLKANSTSKAVISGFYDARGSQTINNELAKNRAKATANALKNAGIDETRIELRKPENVDGGADLNEARRVEVSVE